MALATLSWIALDLPLGRVYGLTTGGVAMGELAQPMVVAARGVITEGWLVRAPNPSPLWSLVLATASGFNPDRLLSVYRWLPLISMWFFASALYWGLGFIDEDERLAPGIGAGLAVFFVLFLASHRLSIFTTGPIWPQIFWLQPRLAFSLGLLAIWMRVLADARRLPGFVLAAALWGGVFWTEPRFGVYSLIGALAWAAVTRKYPPRWGAPLFLALAALVVFPFSGWLSLPDAEPGLLGWHEGLRRFFSMTIERGLVFYFGAFALFALLREGKRSALLFLSLTGSGFILWFAASFSPAASAKLDIALLDVYVRLLLTVAAGVGAQRVLIWLQAHWEPPANLLPGYLRRRPAWVLAMAAFLGLSLPWCFPYWWHPVRMDEVYRDSYEPVAHQFIIFGEWIRRNTEPGSVFVAGPSYAPWIAALGGRRVLMIDGVETKDISARKLAQSHFAASSDPNKVRASARSWELTHYAGGRLDKRWIRVNYRNLRSSPEFEKVWQLRRWVSVFEFSETQ